MKFLSFAAMAAVLLFGPQGANADHLSVFPPDFGKKVTCEYLKCLDDLLHFIGEPPYSEDEKANKYIMNSKSKTEKAEQKMREQGQVIVSVDRVVQASKFAELAISQADSLGLGETAAFGDDIGYGNSQCAYELVERMITALAGILPANIVAEATSFLAKSKAAADQGEWKRSSSYSLRAVRIIMNYLELREVPLCDFFTDPPVDTPTLPPTDPPVDTPTLPPTDPPVDSPTDPPTLPPKTDPPTLPPKTDPPTLPPKPKKGKVKGLVYLDINGNGDRESDEPGIASINVVITDSAGTIYTVTTRANGRYRQRVAPGDAVVDIDTDSLGDVEQTEGTNPTIVFAPSGGTGRTRDGFKPVEPPTPVTTPPHPSVKPPYNY